MVVNTINTFPPYLACIAGPSRHVLPVKAQRGEHSHYVQNCVACISLHTVLHTVNTLKAGCMAVQHAVGNIINTLKAVWLALQAFGGMFCLSGLLGMYGSCVTLAGFCMARHFAVSGISIFKIKVSAACLLDCGIVALNTCRSQTWARYSDKAGRQGWFLHFPQLHHIRSSNTRSLGHACVAAQLGFVAWLLMLYSQFCTTEKYSPHAMPST